MWTIYSKWTPYADWSQQFRQRFGKQINGSVPLQGYQTTNFLSYLGLLLWIYDEPILLISNTYSVWFRCSNGLFRRKKAIEPIRSVVIKEARFHSSQHVPRTTWIYNKIVRIPIKEFIQINWLNSRTVISSFFSFKKPMFTCRSQTMKSSDKRKKCSFHKRKKEEGIKSIRKSMYNSEL